MPTLKADLLRVEDLGDLQARLRGTIDKLNRFMQASARALNGDLRLGENVAAFVSQPFTVTGDGSGAGGVGPAGPAGPPGPPGATDHGALTGLADDDHLQYVKKAGDTMTGPLTVQEDNASGFSVVTFRDETGAFQGNVGYDNLNNFSYVQTANDLYFVLNNTHRARLTTLGKLRLGDSTAPTDQLEVAGGIRSTGNMRNDGPGGFLAVEPAAGNPYFYLSNNNVEAVFEAIGAKGARIGTKGANDGRYLAFGAGNAQSVAGVHTSGIRIGGTVSTAPTEKLEVEGNVKATGDVFPSTNGADLCGRSTNRWASVFTNDLRDGNNVTRFLLPGAAENRYTSAVASSATAIAHRFYCATGITTAGAKLAAWFSDNGTTERANIDKDGRGTFNGGLSAAAKASITAAAADAAAALTVHNAFNNNAVAVLSRGAVRTTYDDCYLKLGAAEFGLTGLYLVGFGWGPYNGAPPVSIGARTTATAGNTTADFVVATRSLTSDTTPVERFKVQADGKVGIGLGTTAATEALDVAGNIKASGSGTFESSVAAQNGVLKLRNTQTDSYNAVRWWDSADLAKLSIGYGNTGTAAPFAGRAYISTGASTDLAFILSTGIEAMRLDASGKLKIGAGAPTEQLDVVGSIKTTGSLQFAGAGASRPAADATLRGKMWFTQGAAGVADTISVCMKDAADAYAWVNL